MMNYWTEAQKKRTDIGMPKVEVKESDIRRKIIFEDMISLLWEMFLGESHSCMVELQESSTLLHS